MRANPENQILFARPSWARMSRRQVRDAGLALILVLSAAGAASAQDVPVPPGEGAKPVPPAGPATAPVPASVEAVEETYLGVVVEPVDAVLRAQLALPDGAGLAVRHVEPQSPAERGAVKVNDVLVKMGDQLLVTPDQLKVLVGVRKADETVPFTVVRGGREQVIDVALGSRRTADPGVPGLEPFINIEEHVIEQVPAEVAKALERAQQQLGRVWKNAPNAPKPPTLRIPQVPPVPPAPRPPQFPGPDWKPLDDKRESMQRTIVRNGESVVTIDNGMTVRVQSSNGTGTITITDSEGNVVLEQSFDSPGTAGGEGSASSSSSITIESRSVEENHAAENATDEESR